MGLKAVANPAAGGQPGSFTTLTVSGAATIGGGLAVTGSISATNGVSLGVNAPLQFAAGLGTAPYLQHTANVLDVKQATSGLRVLNNAGTVALLAMTDGTTTQLSVTGSVSATGQVSASAFATTGYDASGYSTKLLLAGNSTVDNFATFIASNGAGRTYYMGPGVGDGALTTFALYDNTSGATRWRSTTTGFDVTGLTTTDTLRVNVTPTAETPSATHTAVFNINGTNYKFLCLAA